jgi:hypothetical protein
MPLRHDNALPEGKRRNRRAPKPIAPQTPSSLPPIQREGLDISRLQPNQILSLQRSIGNQAVQNLISASRTPVVQTKLEVGPTDDSYEQEADQVAQQVVNDSPAPAASVQRNSVTENDIQLESASNLIQREVTDEDDSAAWTFIDLEDDEEEKASDAQDEALIDLEDNEAEESSDADDGTIYGLGELFGDMEDETGENKLEPYVSLAERRRMQPQTPPPPPTPQEIKKIKKEIGLARRLGWMIALRGARAGDRLMNRFRKQKRTPLMDRAKQGVSATIVAAQNRVDEKEILKNMSRRKRRAYYKQEKEFKKRVKALKKHKGPRVVGF